MKQFLIFLALLAAVTLSAEDQRRFRAPAGVGDGTPGSGGGTEGPPEVIFSDDYNNQGSNIGLGSRTPQTGVDYTRVIATPNTHSLTLVASGYIKASNNAVGQITAYTANPATTATTDQNITIALSGLPSAPSSPAPSGAMFGYHSGTGTRCGLLVYNASANPDVVLYEKLNGTTVTDLATADLNPVAGDSFVIQRRGNNVTVSRNGTTIFGGAVASPNCDTANEAGPIYGADRVATDMAHDSSRWTSIKIENAGTGGGPITLPPSIQVTQPSSSPFLTSLATATFSGTATAGSANLSSVLVTCEGENPVTDQPTTGTPSAWSYTVDLTNPDNTDCYAVVTDAGALTAQSATYRFTRTLGGGGDTTDPTCTWISPASSPVTVSSSPQTLQLACTDDTVPTSASFTNSQIAGTTACQVSAPVAPDATVTCQVPLAANGVTNTITVTVFDAAGNATDPAMTRALVYIGDLTILSSANLGSVTEDVAMTQKNLTASGGVTPFTWSVQGFASLNAVGGACTGLSLSAAGVITGTPTTVGDCVFTGVVVDSQGTPDTASRQFTLTVVVAGSEGPRDYYLALKARSDRLYANEFKCQSSPCANGEASIASLRSNCGTRPCSFTYNYVGDTDPRKQDAMKMNIPEGQASAAGQIRAGIGTTGWNLENGFVTLDFWMGNEWANYAYSDITNHKGTPIYFFRGSQSAQVGIWSGYDKVNRGSDQPPGAPFVSYLWVHTTGTVTSGNIRPPFSWRDQTDGYPRMRLPFTSTYENQRPYNEGLMGGNWIANGSGTIDNPVKTDYSSVGGHGAGAGQEMGVVGERWHRIWFLFERRADEDFSNAAGLPKVAYDVSVWFADTVRGPIQILDQVPIAFNHPTLNTGSSAGHVNEIRIEGSCGAQCEPEGITRPDYVQYYRGLVVLKGISRADAIGLLQKPIP